MLSGPAGLSLRFAWPTGFGGGVQTRAAASASSRRFRARSSSMTVPDGLAVALTSATVAGAAASSEQAAAEQAVATTATAITQSRTVACIIAPAVSCKVLDNLNWFHNAT